MGQNEQNPELKLEPCYERELRSRSYTHEHQELRSWNRLSHKCHAPQNTFVQQEVK